MFLVSDAVAQAAGAPAGSPTGMDSIIRTLIGAGPIIIIFVIFYFMLIRPQQVAATKTRKMLAGLKKGDRVVTSGGILGTVYDLDEQRAVLRIGGDVKVEFLKSAITGVIPEGGSK